MPKNSPAICSSRANVLLNFLHYSALSLLLFLLYTKYTINPNAIQPNATLRVVASNTKIIEVQTITPKVETNGTIGVLNGRSSSGDLTLNTHTPTQTRTNAKSVPKEVKSPATCPGTKAANNPTKTKRIILD